MVQARIRIGARWAQVCILNISEHGIGMQAAAPPARGTYVEVRRGHQVMIGCVTWAKGHRFGIRTQDRNAVDAILREPELSQLEAPGGAPTAAAFERRSTRRRVAESAERSRYLGRGLEFTFVTLLGISVAWVAFESVHQALAAPVRSVSAALDGD